jgi:hypothetical protein
MPNPIHLATWNINHRTGKKAVPLAVLHAVAALDLDVLVLTEFVDGEHHGLFKDALRDIGFASLAVSLKAPRQNQVLIAARTEIADDDLMPLPGYTEAAATNWLHRRLPRLGIEVVGLRAPVYLAAGERAGYWGQVERIARGARDRRVIFIGDFATDPHADTRPCAQVFQHLKAEGFQLPNPAGEWSCHAGNGQGGSRVDHAIASPALRISDAKYLYKAGRHNLAGPANGHGEPLSDHAVLSIKVAV